MYTGFRQRRGGADINLDVPLLPRAVTLEMDADTDITS